MAAVVTLDARSFPLPAPFDKLADYVLRIEEIVHVEGVSPEDLARRTKLPRAQIDAALAQAKAARMKMAADLDERNAFKGYSDPGIPRGEIVRLAEGGMTPDEIAELLEVSATKVGNIMAEHRRTEDTERRQDRILGRPRMAVEMAKEGMSAKEIGERLGKTSSSVATDLSRARSKGETIPYRPKKTPKRQAWHS
jgi:DNA-directed RNA polymerase specialized sigma24 family protein